MRHHSFGESLILRAGCAIQAGALAWIVWRQGGAIDGVLFMHAGWDELSARAVDRAVAGVGLAAALLMWTPFVLGSRVRRAGVLLTGAVFLGQAIAERIAGGQAYAELAPLAHATRWLGPLALLPLSRVGRRRVAEWIMRAAAACTFAIHGVEALGHHPRFVDLILGSARRVPELRLSQGAAERWLDGIGALDLVVAALLVLAPGRFARPVALWAAIWGLATLVSRTVGLGPGFLHESLLRAANAAVPLALYVLLRGRAGGDRG